MKPTPITAAFSRKALHCLLAMCGLFAAKTTWAADAATVDAATALHSIRQGDLFGLIDAKGRVVLAPEFTEIIFGQPLILVRKGQRTAYLDASGRMVVPSQEAWTLPYAEGLMPAMGKDAQGRTRWGYVDSSGKWAITAAYDSAGAFSGGLAVVGLDDAWGVPKYGAINRDGKLVLPAQHDKLLPAACGLVRSENKQRTHRVFDASGRDITPAKIDFVGLPADGMVRVWAGRQQGFMTLAGALSVSPRFAQAGDFSEGRARVWVDGKYGYIDRQGQLVVPAQYDTAEDFSDGLALVKQEGRILFIDHQGRVQLQFHPQPQLQPQQQAQVERAWSFSEGLAVVKVGNQHGYIDKHGKVVIEPQFSFARPFSRGLAYVGLGRSSGYIRPDGQTVWRSAIP